MQKKKYKFLLTKKKRSRSIIEQTHTPIHKKNQTNKEKKIESTKKEKWDQEGNSKISQKMVETLRKWQKLMNQPKMAKTCQSKKTRSSTTGLQLTTFDNRKVLESIFHFLYHWRRNQDINFKKIMGLIIRENRGIETINMQFKFKLFVIFICNPIINIGSSVFFPAIIFLESLCYYNYSMVKFFVYNRTAKKKFWFCPCVQSNRDVSWEVVGHRMIGINENRYIKHGKKKKLLVLR